VSRASPVSGRGGGFRGSAGTATDSAVLTVSGPGRAPPVIYDELCLGTVRTESRLLCRQVIEQLLDAGAQDVILDCTEVELLVGADHGPVPVFPTTGAHGEAAVTAALNGVPIG
jgi:hypothetical protein